MLIDRSQIEAWLREDLGHHDVTNQVPGETTGRLVAKEAGVSAGLEAASAVFAYLDPDIEIEFRVAEGDRIESGTVVLTVDGAAREVLRGERCAVNIVAHASGIATRTRAAVDAAREVSDTVEIACTRKTTPGLRGLEKRAVVAGGGDTHRLDLSHMVMVKDNHIAELGMERAIERLSERASFATKIEVEVETPEDGARAADAGADIVLFDNMSPRDVEHGVTMLPDAVLSETSGGITIADVPDYATTGVDVISMGSLTHSAPALDYSFQTG
ncbi:carboxylating nicotinate-nucleotide diphosphorylase [Halocatena marina]|uniref:Nicotinate-nucleotide pyrophosphorylase [carboxylating] n=1 Tax=Halocatena marina TaxID=2934937 RepID=A0ABD5YVI5_9EURY|nr:carboxylating nicotinate-nucleotide diphosphorylase [Halocatena marina]